MAKSWLSFTWIFFSHVTAELVDKSVGVVDLINARLEGGFGHLKSLLSRFVKLRQDFHHVEELGVVDVNFALVLTHIRHHLCNR